MLYRPGKSRSTIATPLSEDVTGANAADPGGLYHGYAIAESSLSGANLYGLFRL